MKRKITLFAGVILAAAMLLSLSACDKSSEAVSAMSELVPNVITQSTTGGDTTTAPAVITDANGSTYSVAETKSNEELAAIVSEMAEAPITEATTVLDTNTGGGSTAVRTYEDKYAYNTLLDDEKALYANIVENASTLGLKVDPEFQQVDKETWDKVYGMVYNQEPQLFWMSPRLQKPGRIYYRNQDSEAIKTMQAEIDKTVSSLLSQMEGMSDFEKLDFMNTYLALNSTFLFGQETETEANYNSTIYNAFAGGTEKQGDVQCVGYAHAVQYLCDRTGIESMVITGLNDKDESHAWNVVKVNGDWYNFDITWDDPILDTPNYKNVRHMFVLVPDEWILDKTHFSQNLKIYSDGTSFKFFDPPACTSTAENWFIKKGEVYDNAERAVAEITRQLENAAANGLRTTEIMCKDKAVYDAVRGQMKSMQDSLKSKYASVKGISDKCSEPMLVVELDVIYN
jgi:hypothetical protein